VAALHWCDGLVSQTGAIRSRQPDRNTEEVMANADVQKRVTDFAKAVELKDIDRVMSFYEPGVTSFDLNPPLRYQGTDSKRRAWQAFFDSYAESVAYVGHEVTVTTDGDLAIAHSLNHVTGTLASGRAADLWVRWTACFRKTDGIWRIAHDHVSVPVDVEHGTASLNLTP
jgi:uncharacterized protein (TIGR02246 family)